MKIEILQNDGGCTSVKVDGKELNMFITEFSLSQKGHEVPILTLKMFLAEGMEVELPDGVVLAEGMEVELPDGVVLAEVKE